MKFIKTLSLLIPLFTVTSCADDCSYKKYEDGKGDEQCGKFCPAKDDEGNDLLDSSGQVVLEKSKKVDIINCSDSIISSTTSTVTTTTLLNN